MRRTVGLLLALGLLAAADGLRCYVCNSKADSRCADPVQVAEDSDDRDDGKQMQQQQQQQQKGGGGRYDEREQGLQMVDCKVAHSVRQAMDAVNGLLSRLGQRAPGGGDVWAAVRASNQFTSQSGSSGSSKTGGGLLGPRGGGQLDPRDQRDQRDQRGHDEQEPNAACHKVDMEVDGELVTDRGCAPGRIHGQEPCDALAAALGDTEFCELCDGDGCNAAGLVRASASVAAASVLLHGLLLQHGAHS
ncbi:Type II inositol 1,4,5-trisphosphate 5-phosphatase [Frankliniella fusca]|uniref:Type II inositol 1,4,5-trisphosphate 5-phosphatase n=1 Tax=Frankliniella fusca TaxID=407009 RepID=A0AAE1GW81_9NEOP|nr:Type II inositol 1,4,5-trisphosphate 5-phosphatase [Frankliniella fusca]